MNLVEPSPPEPSWPRYSTLPFPSYRFVPGLTPHPRRDPRGHAYGKPERPPPRYRPEDWRQNEVYRHGIDLYNFAFWWECHEALEGLWHLTGHSGSESQFLQGLIQAAAAHLRRHLGSASGPRRLGREAVQRLESVPGPAFMGVTLAPLISGIRELHVDGTRGTIPLIRLES